MGTDKTLGNERIISGGIVSIHEFGLKFPIIVVW